MELKSGLTRKLDRINLETRFGSVEDTTILLPKGVTKLGMLTILGRTLLAPGTSGALLESIQICN